MGKNQTTILLCKGKIFLSVAKDLAKPICFSFTANLIGPEMVFGYFNFINKVCVIVWISSPSISFRKYSPRKWDIQDWTVNKIIPGSRNKIAGLGCKQHNTLIQKWDGQDWTVYKIIPGTRNKMSRTGL